MRMEGSQNEHSERRGDSLYARSERRLWSDAIASGWRQTLPDAALITELGGRTPATDVTRDRARPAACLPTYTATHLDNCEGPYRALGAMSYPAHPRSPRPVQSDRSGAPGGAAGWGRSWRQWHTPVRHTGRGRLRLSDDLTNIHTDERRWRVGHVAELVEGRLSCSSVFLRIEKPERVLDKVPTVSTS
jgi:hypothetical protein